VLTEKEKEEYRSKASLHKKISFISNNFACKEAASKALGTGFTKGVSLKSIEVLREDNGSPYLNLLGAAKKRADKNGYEFFKLSISDTKDHSLAVVIGEGK
jgi:holo-[acyl-carrier protein] synthase